MTDARETVRRFQSTAEHYVRYRSRYPQALIDAVADTRHLDGRRRLLDRGTGPGFLAIALAPRFEATVAMDPDPEMLAVAKAEARATGIVLTLVIGGSEDLGPHLGRFRLVTMGRSFHWMDRDRTLGALDALIEADGAIGLFMAHASYVCVTLRDRSDQPGGSRGSGRPGRSTTRRSPWRRSPRGH